MKFKQIIGRGIRNQLGPTSQELSVEFTIEQFRKERNEALLSLDEDKIRAMLKKFNGIEAHSDSRIFWGGVHKAITGNTDLPIDFRRKSNAWLQERGLRSMDDGDL